MGDAEERAPGDDSGEADDRHYRRRFRTGRRDGRPTARGRVLTRLLKNIFVGVIAREVKQHGADAWKGARAASRIDPRGSIDSPHRSGDARRRSPNAPRDRMYSIRP